MIKDIKFLATTVQPNSKEVTHWVDLNEDPTGGVIKTFNGKEWKSITSSNSDSDKYVNMIIDVTSNTNDQVTIDGKVYDIGSDFIIYDTDLLNYLKDIYNSDKRLIIDYTTSGGIEFTKTKANTYVVYSIFSKSDTSYEAYGINLSSFIDGLIIEVVDTDFPGFEST